MHGCIDDDFLRNFYTDKLLVKSFVSALVDDLLVHHLRLLGLKYLPIRLHDAFTDRSVNVPV